MQRTEEKGGSTASFSVSERCCVLRHGVVGAKDGSLSSYAFTLLVIFYLQIEHGLLLRDVRHVRRAHPHPPHLVGARGGG